MPLHLIPAPAVAPAAFLDLAKTSKITVSETDYTEYSITYDVIAIIADADVYVSKLPTGAGFLLFGGVYLAFKASDEMTALYVKSATGSTNVWIAEFILRET